MQGRSFARIASELNISKRTLINWSRKFQFEIQNHRVVELEALQEKYLASREEQVARLGEQLTEVEEELKKRSMTDLSTLSLFTLAESLRRKIKQETGEVRFSTPLKDIPSEEYHEEAQDWTV